MHLELSTWRRTGSWKPTSSLLSVSKDGDVNSILGTLHADSGVGAEAKGKRDLCLRRRVVPVRDLRHI